MTSITTPTGRLAFFRFAFVGGLCFVTGMLAVYIFTEFLGWHYLLSTAAAMLAANLLGWLLNRSWTFGLRRQRSAAEFLRYLAVNTGAMAVSIAAVGLLVRQLQLHYVLACAVVAMVMAVVNFVAHGRWSLKPDHLGGA